MSADYPRGTRFFVCDKSRLCRIVRGQPVIDEAIRDGFREVETPEDIDAFRAVTKVALDAGWKPARIGYAKFMAKHPELESPRALIA